MNRKVLGTLFAALLMMSCGGGQKTSDDSSGAEVAVPSFSSDSAYSYVAAQCAYGPRVMNSAAHDSCGEYIARRFKSFGAVVTDQYADLQMYDGTPIKIRNIVASYNVDNPSRIMICGHWDSRPWADNDDDSNKHKTPIDGANDGASGIGVMLEVARQLQQSAPGIGIDLVCFDAEDCGTPMWARDGGLSDESTWCLGSQYWSANFHTEGYTARYAILLDMVGGENCLFRKEGFSMEYAPGIIDKVWAAAKKNGFANYFVNEEGGYITDDHLPVNRMGGIPCIDIIASDRDGNSFCSTWHTVNDNMKYINKQTLHAVGQTLLYVIYNEN